MLQAVGTVPCGRVRHASVGTAHAVLDFGYVAGRSYSAGGERPYCRPGVRVGTWLGSCWRVPVGRDQSWMAVSIVSRRAG